MQLHTIAVKVVGLWHTPQQQEDGKNNGTKEGASRANLVSFSSACRCSVLTNTGCVDLDFTKQ